MPQQENRYTAIGYSVPASPSKLRVYVWRKLRQMGAENVKPGLAVLPENTENRRMLAELAEIVREMGGESSVYTLIFADIAEERALIRLFAQRTKDELEKLHKQLESVTLSPTNVAANRKLINQVQKTIGNYEKMGAPPDPSVRKEVERALRQVMDAVRSLPSFVSEELHDLLK